MFLQYLLGLCLFGYSTQISPNDYFYNVSSSQAYTKYLQEYMEANPQRLHEKCELDLRIYLDSLRNKTWWSANMFDSGTKIPSGILRGNLVDFGAFDQCMAVKSPSKSNPIYGRYCLGSIPFSSLSNKTQTRGINPEFEMSVMYATCLPHTCSHTDFEHIYSNQLIKTKFYTELCQTVLEKPKLSNGAIAMISFLGTTLVIMILSTIYDSYLFYADQKPCHVAFIAFSVLSNGRKLFAVTSTSNHISCLHGIRAISMMWIILGHRYGFITMTANRNWLDLIKWLNIKGNMYLMGAAVSVDTFFVLSGLLVCYCFMMALSQGHKFNIFFYYLHRYLRLTPVLAVIIFLHTTVLEHLGSGPWWPLRISPLSVSCQYRWWAALLYIQNYAITDKGACIPPTWYLSVDTQLFLISPLILLPLRKWPLVGFLITGGLAVASTIYCFVVAYIYNFKGLALGNNSEEFSKFYVATHARVTPWLMGIILGYYIFQIKKGEKRKIRLGNLLVLSMWAVALGILAACVFTGHGTLFKHDRVGDAFYVALLRPGWAVGLSMMIMLCVLGYGGPINWFLSVGIFQVLSRLTYTMYLLHLTMETIVSSQNRTATDIKDLNILYSFWGDYMFTLGAAIIMTLAYESPILTLEKIIFGKTKRVVENKTLEDEPKVQTA